MLCSKMLYCCDGGVVVVVKWLYRCWRWLCGAVAPRGSLWLFVGPRAPGQRAPEVPTRLPKRPRRVPRHPPRMRCGTCKAESCDLLAGPVNPARSRLATIDSHHLAQNCTFRAKSGVRTSKHTPWHPPRPRECPGDTGRDSGRAG